MQEIKNFLSWLDNQGKFITLCELEPTYAHWHELSGEEISKLLGEYSVYLKDRPGPGKFEGNEFESVARYLHTISMDGHYEESYGEVESSFGWNALVYVDWSNYVRDSTDDFRLTSDKLKPAYIITEDNNGFFTYKEFESEDEAREEFESGVNAYAEAYANA